MKRLLLVASLFAISSTLASIETHVIKIQNNLDQEVIAIINGSNIFNIKANAKEQYVLSGVDQGDNCLRSADIRDLKSNKLASYRPSTGPYVVGICSDVNLVLEKPTGKEVQYKLIRK